jgi:hypothetical protein
MIFYDSNYLSRHLNINPARWKRWARTFLPPDPLGGLQSGVARQFNLKEAFKVYLGGYLVGELKFALPDAQQVLGDLSPWLKSNGFYSMQAPSETENRRMHYIYIFNLPKHKFGYTIRTVVSINAMDNATHLSFLQTCISVDHDLMASGEAMSASVLAVTTLYRHFLSSIEQQSSP